MSQPTKTVKNHGNQVRRVWTNSLSKVPSLTVFQPTKIKDSDKNHGHPRKLWLSTKSCDRFRRRFLSKLMAILKNCAFKEVRTSKKFKSWIPKPEQRRFRWLFLSKNMAIFKNCTCKEVRTDSVTVKELRTISAKSKIMAIVEKFDFQRPVNYFQEIPWKIWKTWKKVRTSHFEKNLKIEFDELADFSWNQSSWL